MESLPYLTHSQPGIGGHVKAKPEDFIVEEIPLYQPSDEGEHLYLWIEKRSVTTYQVINDLARQLNVPHQAIGYAGIKDARAVSRQMLSVHGAEPGQVQNLSLANVTILWARRHRNKLKMGHLAGNRFTIRVRELTPDALATAQAILDELGRRGVPNYFGEQRFGARQNNHLLGWALLRGDADAFVKEYLGHPRPDERPDVQAARSAFDAGDYVGALARWPAYLRDERRLLAALVRHGADAQPVLRSLDKKLRRLLVSAYQSHLFNRLLAQRMQSIDRLEEGDVAFIHASGAAFVVQDVALEQPRADRFEISPSGPLYGPKLLLAEKEPGRRERDLLNETGLDLLEFRTSGVRLKGARRPFRIPLTDVEVTWDEGLVIGFCLPSGGYATEVLREIMKPKT